MKLATYADGSRDGQLVVVSRDLRSAHYASRVAGRLQQVLDDWNFLAPQLEEISRDLNQGKLRHAFEFDVRQCMAPLPRAYQWAMRSACHHLGERVDAGGIPRVPPGLSSEPLMFQGASDHFVGPCEPILCTSADLGIDFGAGIAVVTGDVAQGTQADAALDGIRLLMLVNEVSLRRLIPAELAQGFGFLQSKPATAFGPVAITPDETGDAWRGGRLHLSVESTWNGKRVGLTDAAATKAAGPQTGLHFGQLIAHLCRTRELRAGSCIGGGTVVSADRSRGFACIAEKRTDETALSGNPKTAYLATGDRVRIDMTGSDGMSLCGAIEQTVVSLHIELNGAQ